jgi:hypothetical protein
MHGMQRVALVGSWLVTAACTAEITGGGDAPSEAENQVLAGAAAPVIGAAGAPAQPPPRSQTATVPVAGKGAAGADATSGKAGAAAPPPSASDAAGAPAAGAGGAKATEPDPPSDPEEPAADPATQVPDETGELVPGGVRFLGRVDARDPDAARFSWAGSGFAAIVEGATISVRLTSQSSSVFFQPVIDGEPGERFEVKVGDQTVTLASGMSDAPHTVEVYRDTEGDGPLSIFRGFAEGMLLGAPRASGRFIEVIGDSISAGYGSLGSERHGSNAGPGCGAKPSNSSWFATYSAVAGRELDAEVSVVARSGYGMVRGYGQNSNVMPPFFDDTIAGSNSPTWSFEHKPQAVIINLGTNDWNGGDPGASYESAYIKFLTEVRMRYPDAWILLTVGSSLEPKGAKQCGTRLGNIVEARMEAGDDKIDSFDIGLQDSSMTGCGWHPSAAEHMRMGMVLVEELKGRLGW